MSPISSCISILCNSSIDRLSGWVTCDGGIGEQRKSSICWVHPPYLSLASAHSFICFNNCLLSDYYVPGTALNGESTVRHKTVSPHGTYFLGCGVGGRRADVGQRVESSLPPNKGACLGFCSCPWISLLIGQFLGQRDSYEKERTCNISKNTYSDLEQSKFSL